jgi:dTDP-4-dehydrorhamnose 3,5-epimerase
MIFEPLPLTGAYLIKPELRGDDRGSFARMFCQREFADHGLETNIVQINNALNLHKGTLRGLHYQLPPNAEVKVIRCIAGRAWDVILDLRSGSLTFGRWFGAELSADNRTMMYAPRGFAHGYITLADNTELTYLTSAFYAPDGERCVRWNDPHFAIAWPAKPEIISAKDRAQPDFALEAVTP